MLFLSESIVTRPGTCVIQYKKTSCDPEKQEIITIASGESGGEACSGP